MRADEPRLFGLALLMGLAVAPTMAAFFFDARTFLGVDVWGKPLKFEFALFVYLLTLAFFARWVAPATKARLWYRIYVGGVVAAVIAEMAWIGGAAALGTASHFNTSAVGSALYSLMGAAAAYLTSLTAVYAVLIARNRQAGLAPALREGVVLGLALVLPLTLITAGTMSGMGTHFVGGSGSDAGGLAVMGWARDGGDLRVAHFFATHALHFVPAFALLSAWLFGSGNRAPIRLFAMAYAGFVLLTFVQALSGQPFLGFLRGA